MPLVITRRLYATLIYAHRHFHIIMPLFIVLPRVYAASLSFCRRESLPYRAAGHHLRAGQRGGVY